MPTSAVRCDGWEIGEARCKVVAEAKERRVKYLFFLDWDVLIPPTTLVRLVYLAENNPEFDVFSGIYCLKQDPPEVLVWRGEWGNGISWNWTLNDVLTDVVGVGTGCMLIRMSVFDKLDPSIPYFKTSIEHNENPDGSFTRKEMTDDIWFCKRVIEEAKSRIMVDTGILCGHIDNATGVVYTLPDDCLPIRRHDAIILKQAEEKSQRWLGNGAAVLQQLAQEVVTHSTSSTPQIVTTAKVMADSIAGRGVLHCVDTWDGTANEYTGIVGANLIGPGNVYRHFTDRLNGHLGKTVVTHKTTSVRAAEEFVKAGTTVDMVFIDADHTRCEEDIRAWLPCVNPNTGIICGHDHSSEFPEVIAAVDKLFGKSVEVRERIWIKRFGDTAA